MRSIEVGGGTVTITDETLQIDISPMGAAKRLYKQSKLIVGLLIGGLLFEIVLAILYSGFFMDILKFIFIFAISGFVLASILPRLMSNIAAASEIPRETVNRVEYTTGSRLSAPKLRIIVTDGENTGTRPVPLSHRQIGGDQELEDAIKAFEDAGITIVPTDGDS